MRAAAATTTAAAAAATAAAARPRVTSGDARAGGHRVARLCTIRTTLRLAKGGGVPAARPAAAASQSAFRLGGGRARADAQEQ
eukprot:scaffold13712_cov45-Phaeocystis_antarctica.AAC.1